MTLFFLAIHPAVKVATTAFHTAVLGSIGTTAYGWLDLQK